jgi:hypothetical protein
MEWDKMDHKGCPWAIQTGVVVRCQASNLVPCHEEHCAVFHWLQEFYYFIHLQRNT